MHHLEKQAKHTGVFQAYFFCDEKDFYRRIIRDVLKLLIRQMMWKSRDLAQHLLVDEGIGKKGGRKSQNFDNLPLAALWGSLQKMLSDTSVEKVYFIVKAFDETDKESRKVFLSQLEPNLKPPSEEQGDDETSVKENAGFVNDGVKREISGQVDRLAGQKDFNDALTYLIKRYVYAKADGNFIYANPVVQELKNLDSSQTIDPPSENL
ncbi:MAG: hypothetical protein Q9164_004152 [Protoblastenia rupestris]